MKQVPSLDAQSSQRQTRMGRATAHMTGQEMHGALGGSPRVGKGYKKGMGGQGLRGLTS